MALSFSPSKDVSSTYAKVTFSTTLAVTGTLKPKESAPASAGGTSSGSGGSATASVEVYRPDAARAGVGRLAQLAADSIDRKGYEVEKAEIVAGAAKGTFEDAKEGVKEAGDTYSMSVGVKLTFKNGDSTMLDASLFEKKSGDPISGPGLKLSHTFKLANETLWENESAMLTISGSWMLAAKLQPEWKKIGLLIAEKGAPNVAKAFLSSACRGLASSAISAGFIAGGIATLVTLGGALSSAHDTQECITKAQEAADSYVCGVCTSWGITNFGTGNDFRYYGAGFSLGTGKLMDLVRQIQQNEMFAAFNFTPDEILNALKPMLAENADEVAKQVRAQTQQKIFSDFAREFYTKGIAAYWPPDDIVRQDARLVARTLGVDDSFIQEEEE